MSSPLQKQDLAQMLTMIKPPMVIDPIGTIFVEFLNKFSRKIEMLLRQGALPSEEVELVWERVRYVDMSAKSGLFNQRIDR